MTQKRIQITADSTCDLTEALLQRYQIRRIPLYVQMGGQTYRDGVDVQPEDIFRYVEQEGSLCSTAAVSVYDYTQHFARLSGECEAVIHINIGQKFSSSYQNACLAAESFPNVYVLDSANLSTGQGLLVLRAAEMAQEGRLSAPEIVRRLEQLRPLVDASFVMDRLDYMRRGGRCSSVEAFGANLLQLKPCIAVRDGAMGVERKYRGAFQRVLQDYVDDRLQHPEQLDPQRIFITCAGTEPEIVQQVARQVQEKGIFREILCTTAGCTVSNHCGPHTLGILYFHKEGA